MEWHVEILNKTVDKELHALPADMRARFVRICQLIAAVGVDRMGAPHVRHLSGPLWEMRLTGRDGIPRALYVATKDMRLVVVRVFFKKTSSHAPPGDRIGAATRRGDDDMSKIADLHKEWSRDPEYQEAYDRLGAEFELTRALIEARTGAGFTQAELAERMETTQSS